MENNRGHGIVPHMRAGPSGLSGPGTGAQRLQTIATGSYRPSDLPSLAMGTTSTKAPCKSKVNNRRSPC